MTVFTKRAVNIFAPTTAAGVPRRIDNGEVQVWGTEAETLLNAIGANGGLIYETRADLYADVDHDANTLAWVVADSTVAYNGIYQKSGASGAGSWIRRLALPYGLNKATDAGGTANAIAATTTIPVSESQLIILPIATTNTTAAVTVAFNGGSDLPIKTNTGGNPAIGGLVQGMNVLGMIADGTFRLFTEQDVAGVVAAAEAAQAAAEAAASSVQPTLVSKAAASGYNPASAPAFLKTAGYYEAGDFGDALYKLGGAVADLTITLDNASTQDFELADRWIDIRACGAKATGDSADAAANAAAIRRAIALTGCAYIPWTALGFHLGTEEITLDDDQHVVGYNGLAKVLGSHGNGEAIFKFTGYEQYKSIRNLYFDMSDASSGSAAIKYVTDAEIVFKTRVENCFFTDCWGAVIQPDDDYDIGETIWKDLKSEYAKGTQFWSSKSNGFVILDNVNVDLTKSISGDYEATWVSIQLDEFIGIKLVDTAVTGQAVAQFGNQGYEAGAVGIKLDGTNPSSFRFVWIEGWVRVEASRGPGIQIFNTVFVKGGGSLESFSSLGVQINFNNVDYIQLVNMKARGAFDYPGTEPAGADGIIFEDCVYGIISNIVAAGNTGSGVLIKNSTKITLIAPQTNDNAVYGIAESGTSDGNTVIEHVSTSDTAAFAILGANTEFRGQIVNGVRRPNDLKSVTVYNGSAGAPGATFAKLALNTVLAGNYAGKWDTTNSQLTGVTGTIKVSGRVYFATGAVDQSTLDVAIFRDGAEYERCWVSASGTGDHSVPVSFTVPSVSAYVWDIRVKVPSSGTIPANGSFTFVTWEML